jgi:hypothetical protein
MSRFAKRLVLLALLTILPLLLWPASNSPLLRAQLSTDDHLADPGFWPTQSAATRKGYVGAATCAQCHAAIVATQSATPMGATAMRVADSSILRSHPTLAFSFDKFRYQIKSSSTQSLYTVTDGSRTLSANLLWAFGTDRVGQSYLFKQDDGKFYEARVTYFDTLKTLHFTPDRALTSAKDLEQAMFRPVDQAEINRCFSCHTTAPVIAGHFDENNLVPGVTCEACHGPGATHVNAMQAAKIAGVSPQAQGTIFTAAQLSPADSVDFCGSCHGTWWDVKLSGVKGVSNVKSQPYRLEGSKCWGKGDARLECVTCHDPHKQLQTDPASYDSNCLSCHDAAGKTATDQKNSGSGGKQDPGQQIHNAVETISAAKNSSDHSAPPCPVATKNCTTCHMPKVYVPEMHYDFTDHRIRIARPNEPYPE